MSSRVIFTVIWAIVYVVSVLSDPTHQSYESIDVDTIARYTSDWLHHHKSWVGINPDLNVCDDTSQVTYPICIDNYVIKESYTDSQLLGSEQCPAALCIARATNDNNCFYTPFDTMDYLPPSATSSLDNHTICYSEDIAEHGDAMISSDSFAMDLGLPPLYLPIIPVRLNITGTVSAFSTADKCTPIVDAEITAWQVNPAALNTFTADKQFRHAIDSAKEATATQKGTPFSRTTVGKTPTPTPQTELQVPRNHSLRGVSCRATQHTNADGGYTFMTLVPPSYGPPRHVMFQISAPGYETLTTRMYFDRDWRLQQLTTLQGEVTSDSVTGPDSLASALGFHTDRHRGPHDYPHTPVTQDPRVAKLLFRPTAAPSAGGVTGLLETEFHFVLRPLRSTLIQATTATSADGSLHSIATTAAARDTSAMPPVDLRGLWADSQGALVRIETHGPSFIAHEYPHSRSWGTAMGLVSGGAVRGVDFHQVLSEQDVSNAQSQRNNPLVDFDPASTTWTASGTTTGTIVPADPFSTAPFSPQSPQAASIQWTGGGYENLWTKQPDTSDVVQGYRYLKLLITRETGGMTGGSLILNEIEFYQGILAQDARPTKANKMTTPRFPVPQMVTCSSFLTQDYHCYRAFDGDLSSHSAWITKPVGSAQHVLETPQWVTFDFGVGHGVSPTAMKIMCNAQNAATEALGCPMTFTLLGSHDNVKFTPLLHEDLYDYNRDFGTAGKTFYLYPETSQGLRNGQRCGSCSSAPDFTCVLDAYDGSCESRYCGQAGLCAPEPACPPGEYMYYGFKSHSQPAFRCKQCAAGRYGSEAGLRSSGCSGLCAEGHFCPAGSVSATQFPCGDASVYCPEGSPRPIPAAAGRFTVSRAHLNLLGVANTTEPPRGLQDPAGPGLRVADRLCPQGSYCKSGVSTPCPVGRYGNSTGLQTEQCEFECEDGDYCPAGSVVPVKCPKGYYCPDGKVPIICPAGTYGETEGLKDRQCSGYCSPGYYCTAGSVIRTSALCPAGTYGATAGLTNSTCSGLCAEGHYCPPASTSATQVECGDASVYCPVGSKLPTAVTRGYYSIGGTSDRTRSCQVAAEAGFYATEGVKWPCRAGTYGEISGLSADRDLSLTPSPTEAPSCAPSMHPSAAPSAAPSTTQTATPTVLPTTGILTPNPSIAPTTAPTLNPTDSPTINPTRDPTAAPTLNPTRAPTVAPTCKPTAQPTVSAGAPTFKPSAQPTVAPSLLFPTSMPSVALLVTRPPTFAPSHEEELPYTDFVCSGLCAFGHYCPRNTTKQLPCPAGRYGIETGLTNAQCTAVCPIGHYCPAGSVVPIECPPGVYGNSTGLKDVTCSTDCWSGGCNPTAQLCQAGFYCPKGSISATQVPCGGADVYCPRGSSVPTPVSAGHYTIGSTDTFIHNNVDSSDRVSATATDTQAQITRVAQVICEEGHYCFGGIKRNCPPGVYGGSKGLTSAACSGLCAKGHYCPEGSVNATTHRCPAGRYGATMGLMDSACSGLCTAGFHCPEASISATQLECAVLGRAGTYRTNIGIKAKDFVAVSEQAADPRTQLSDVYMRTFDTTTKALPGTTATITEITEANSVYCPVGTAVPLTVRPGYYTVGGNRTTRFGQEICPMGSYCVNGQVSLCPPGRYGRAERLTSSECTGLCVKGYYCPIGSISSTQVPCPIGRYGATEGLSSPACSGPCVKPLDCPLGSVVVR